jgi:hypothetical protein
MSKVKPLSDAEIAELLGTARPLQPMEPVPDPNVVLQKQLLESVQNWLIRKVSLAEVQTQLLTPDTIPSFRSEFEEFVLAATESHDMWEFCSSQSDWDRLAGRSGFALVKDGRVTHAIVTVES